MRFVAACLAAALAILAGCSSGSSPTEDETPGPDIGATQFLGAKLHVNPDNPARMQANAWRATRPADAALIDRIGNTPVAEWIAEWNSDLRGDVDGFVTDARAAGAMPVLVPYMIPHRDCGSYAAGGSSSAAAYRQWMATFASALRGRRTVVILEPDALSETGCLSAAQLTERLTLLREAVHTLKSANAIVYIDAGNATWATPAQVAKLLEDAGIAEADGFSLNVSNFLSTSMNVSYGSAVSALVGGKHFIIDTSRNGMGATEDQVWCNPPNQALGAAPSTNTGLPLVDALLWVKFPGESDGTCNGGPAAGEWWPEYALDLARRQPKP